MKLTLQGAVAAGKAAAAAIRGDVVSGEVILERAKVCLKCPMRRRTIGISAVSKLLAQLARQNNADKNISDFSCGICGCSLLLLLSAIPENLHKDTEQQKAKRNKTKCWMNEL